MCLLNINLCERNDEDSSVKTTMASFNKPKVNLNKIMRCRENIMTINLSLSTRKKEKENALKLKKERVKRLQNEP